MPTTTAHTKPLKTKPIRHTVTYSVPPAPSEAKAADDLQWFTTEILPGLLQLHKLDAAELWTMTELFKSRRPAFVQTIRVVKAIKARKAAKRIDDDPDSVDIPTAPVSAEQDERNSRPEPY